MLPLMPGILCPPHLLSSLGLRTHRTTLKSLFLLTILLKLSSLFLLNMPHSMLRFSNSCLEPYRISCAFGRKSQ